MAGGASRRAPAAVTRAAGLRRGHQQGRDGHDVDIVRSKQVKQATKGETTSRGGQRLATEARDEALSVVLGLLDARRRAAGHSRTALARALGVSASTLSRLFAGRYGHRGLVASLATQDGLERIERALRLLARKGNAPKPEDKRGSVAPTPRVDEAVRPAPSTATSATSTRPSGDFDPFRILIAEDEADILELYQMVLADDDVAAPSAEPRYEITVTRTAEDCLTKLRTAAASGLPFDLLLMDLGIGDPRRGTGEGTLLMQLRARTDLAPRRILVVSGVSPYLLARKEDDLAALGAAFLPKPFDIDVFSAAVAKLCMPGDAPVENLRYFS